MDKLNLGDDFTGDEGAPAEAIKEVEEEEGDENKEGEIEENDDEEGDGEKPNPEDKNQQLQGLIDQEKALDADSATIDEQITAARKRISEKRRARRENRELAGKINEVLPEEDDGEQDDLSDIDPETIKVLDRFVKAKGFVHKSELGKMTYTQAHKASEESFYQSHPEYLPENDADDALYNALKEELSYFAAPKDPKKIPELFEKAHKHVVEKHPEKFKTRGSDDKSVTKEVKKSSALIKKSSLGGNAGGSGVQKRDSGEKKSFSDKQLQALRAGGWTEEDIKGLTS